MPKNQGLYVYLTPKTKKKRLPFFNFHSPFYGNQTFLGFFFDIKWTNFLEQCIYFTNGKKLEREIFRVFSVFPFFQSRKKSRLFSFSLLGIFGWQLSRCNSAVICRARQLSTFSWRAFFSRRLPTGNVTFSLNLAPTIMAYFESNINVIRSQIKANTN